MVHSFGGVWTERKLSVVRRYLEIYAQALKHQPFERVYIDAFAGTGDRTNKRRETQPLLDLPELDAIAKGSARLALEVEPPFQRYILIERATRRASELASLKSQFSGRNIEIVNADANEAIAKLCRGINWRSTRGRGFSRSLWFAGGLGVPCCDFKDQSTRRLDLISVRHGAEPSANEIRRHSAGMAGHSGSKSRHHGMAKSLLQE